MKICLLTPALPPKLDGLGDYSSLLAQTLSSKHEMSIIHCVQSQIPDLIPEVMLIPGYHFEKPKSVLDIPHLIPRSKPDWLIIQYNPFSYGRRGMNLYLPAMMKQIQRIGTKVAIMIHEPYVRRLDIKHTIMSIWQRWQLKKLVEYADCIFVSIEEWARYIDNWAGSKQIHHLPVGSNIPRVSINKFEQREIIGIKSDELVIGLFGSNHSSVQHEFNRDAIDSIIQSNIKTKVLYIGPHGDVFKSSLKDCDFINLGKLPPNEVSKGLSCMDIFLSSFIDGISTRRGTVMAALEHGIPIVGTYGINTDSIFINNNNKAVVLSDAMDSKAFSSSSRKLASNADLSQYIGFNASKIYETEFDWKIIASRIEEILYKF